MVRIIGKGVLKPYCQTLRIDEPVLASGMYELLKLPETYRDNIVAVRDGKVLQLDENVNDSDEIVLFVSVMGG